MKDINKALKSFAKEIIFFEDLNDSNLWNSKILEEEFNSIKIFSNYIKYYQSYFNAEKNNSFKITIDNISVVNLMFSNEEKIIFFDPVLNNYFFKNSHKIEIFYKNLFDHIYTKTNKKIIIYDLPNPNKNIDFYYFIISKYKDLRYSFDLYVDLTKDINQIWASIRKSYKSLINKSKNLLEFSIEKSPEKMKKLKKLHLKISGRVTRSNSTWQIQEKMINDDQGIIFDIKLFGQTVGMSFFTYDKKIAYYDIGVYERDISKKYNISHFMIWNAVNYFKSTGKDKIYLDKYKLTEDPKIIDIVNFKLGFSNLKILSATTN